jgi:uncharacterized protein (TIGR02145 family)
MKSRSTTCFAALILLAISCKKENTTIQSSVITNQSSTQVLSSEANEPGSAHAVRIGTQVWKIKNLNVSNYRNGDLIPQVKNPTKWAALTTGAWCWYNNDSANGAIYGKLYNWYAVTDPRGLAPEGWHIPTDGEWTALSSFLGGDGVAGGKMKSIGTIETGTGLWYAPNTDATNSSGFTGLPGGYRYSNGRFTLMGYYGYWWSSTVYNTTSAWSHNLTYGEGKDYRFIDNKPGGFSVRCLKD